MFEEMVLELIAADEAHFRPQFQHSLQPAPWHSLIVPPLAQESSVDSQLPFYYPSQQHVFHPMPPLPHLLLLLLLLRRMPAFCEWLAYHNLRTSALKLSAVLSRDVLWVDDLAA